MSTTTPAKRAKTGGGSRKGIGNKKKVAFTEELESLCEELDFSPARAMVTMAQNAELDPELRFKATKEIWDRLYPKPRFVQLSGDAEHPLHVAHAVKMSLSEALQKTYGAQEQRQNGQRIPQPRPLLPTNGH